MQQDTNLHLQGKWPGGAQGAQCHEQRWVAKPTPRSAGPEGSALPPVQARGHTAL